MTLCVPVALAGCDGQVVNCTDGGCGGSPPATPAGATTKLDLLFVIDNSPGMADHQVALTAGVRRLLDGLTNPPCVEGDTVVYEPADLATPCPVGAVRRHAPLRDIHIGVISSSLGALTLTGQQCGDATQDDRAHLLSRARGGGTVATYLNQGFLAFDADATMSPPGDPSLDSVTELLTEIIAGVGDTGCGYEMPLEAMTRFLVVPEPYDSLYDDGSALYQPMGIDQVVLQQRQDFLRPDSAVAVVLFSNENDCSTDTFSLGHYLFLDRPYYKATSVCQEDPNDPCCTSCALGVPLGCVPDPACGPDVGTSAAYTYTIAEDPKSLRCWEQKRRYGTDFLFPISRYVNALTLQDIDPRMRVLTGDTGYTVPNPLFAGGRSPSDVHLLVLAGAPWQDVASDPSSGSSPLLNSEQLEASGQFEWLVGGEPFTDESIVARSGANPAIGAIVAGANPINGGDRTIPSSDDLQYACITPLASPEVGGCGSCGPSCDDPTCSGEDRIAARAFPGIRAYQLARSLGAGGTAASICPSDPAAPFRTALDAFAIAVGRSVAQ
ncbi:MAG: hypothetical protein HOV80_18890 [Polyangiaceae bacterium]|nr:hypothetical protein [Polyangiaceae bacterium]